MPFWASLPAATTSTLNVVTPDGRTLCVESASRIRADQQGRGRLPSALMSESIDDLRDVFAQVFAKPPSESLHGSGLRFMATSTPRRCSPTATCRGRNLTSSSPNLESARVRPWSTWGAAMADPGCGCARALAATSSESTSPNPPSRRPAIGHAVSGCRSTSLTDSVTLDPCLWPMARSTQS